MAVKQVELLSSKITQGLFTSLFQSFHTRHRLICYYAKSLDICLCYTYIIHIWDAVDQVMKQYSLHSPWTAGQDTETL